jgi:bifunctional UDP-N-acetylglucosamine pyrophosphorylase/glucosamine-1-phosphate N-acetyltransferase
MNLDVVILAAGQGKRMHSDLPKVLHPIAGKPMLSHVLAAAESLGDCALHVVIGHEAEQVRRAIPNEKVNWVVQKQQLGTGDAVAKALPHCRTDSCVLVLYGDVPLVNPAVLASLVRRVKAGESMALLTANMLDPTGYGRIIRSDRGEVTSVVEQKDASSDQLRILEVNTGIMAVSVCDLKAWLPNLNCDNAQGEYYLTDVVSIANQSGILVLTETSTDINEVLGVNNRQQQAFLERAFQRRQADQLMSAGATLIDPARFDLRGTLFVGRDVLIDANVIFEGQVSLGNNVVIEANCFIRDTVIGDNCRIKSHSIIEQARIAQNVDVGPFARLRPGTVLEKGAKIGNFVETKNAILGEGSKASHLSYLGDVSVGEECNIGAGTITCNYDGVNKHKTVIEDRVFIGSNSTLVAPVIISEDGFVGAGSTITKNIPAATLGIGRERQKNIHGWSKPVNKKD